MGKREEKLPLQKCENPNCRKTFSPYNSRQRICGNYNCKIWLLDKTKYTKVRYYLTRNWTERIIEIMRTEGGSEHDLINVMTSTELTKDDLIKVD
jgi:hypothetical protein